MRLVVAACAGFIFLGLLGAFPVVAIDPDGPRGVPKPSPEVEVDSEISPIPEIDCGFAGDPEKSQCCDDVAQDIIRAQGETIETGMPSIVEELFQPVLRVMFDRGSPVMRDPLLNSVAPRCYVGVHATTADGECVCVPQEERTESEDTVQALESLCDNFIVPDNEMPDGLAERMLRERENCFSCASIGGYYSTIGCIPADLSTFIGFLLTFGVGLGGLVTFGCVIYSAIMLQTSRGEADAIQKAREQLTSCIVGLIMIIFSVFILRVIGVDLLRLPGFAGSGTEQEESVEVEEDPEEVDTE